MGLDGRGLLSRRGFLSGTNDIGRSSSSRVLLGLLRLATPPLVGMSFLTHGSLGRKRLETQAYGLRNQSKKGQNRTQDIICEGKHVG